MRSPAFWLGASLVVFLIFIANVFVASSSGTALVGRTGELLLILLTSVLFVTGTLRSEARARASLRQKTSREETI